MHSRAPRTTQETPGMHPRAHRSTQEAPSSSQEAPRSTQEAPGNNQSHPGDTQETPRRHPEDTQQTPRRKPGDTQKHQGPRRPFTAKMSQNHAVLQLNRARVPIPYENCEGDVHRYYSLRTKMSGHSRSRSAAGLKAPLIKYHKNPYS
jgi:hypothetical protein